MILDVEKTVDTFKEGTEAFAEIAETGMLLQFQQELTLLR